MSDFYTPLRETLPPLELDVVMPNRLTGELHRVHITARHLLYREFVGLEDLLIGVIQSIADPTGKREMMARRVKLKAVLERVSNLNPAIYPGGEISDSKEVEKWVDAEENSDAVFAAWAKFAQSIDNPPVKSGDEGDSTGSGEGAGVAEEERSLALV